jgi:restriction endonuclease S subunit
VSSPTDPADPTGEDAWLSVAPEHWVKCAPKYLMRSASGGNAIKGDCSPEPFEGGFQGFSASGPDVWINEAQFNQSGIVLSAVGAQCGKTFKADGRWGVVANTHCLIPLSNADRDYLWYVTNLPNWWEKGGSAQPFVKVQDTLSRRWAFPRLPEQRAIAAFLDRETAKIDALIGKQEELIRLVGERFAAKISTVVAEGISPSEMKKSGRDWLGDVPAHWTVRKLVQIANAIGDGLHGTPEYSDDAECLFVNGTNFVNGRIRITDKTRTVSEIERIKHITPLGDETVLLSINGTIGNLALYNKENIILGKSAAYINCGASLNRNFLFFYLQSYQFKFYVETELAGTTIRNFSLESIRGLAVPLPPLREQREIASYLSARAAAYYNSRSAINDTISVLNERRSALITAAVTGQIEVANNIPAEAAA